MEMVRQYDCGSMSYRNQRLTPKVIFLTEQRDVNSVKESTAIDFQTNLLEVRSEDNQKTVNKISISRVTETSHPRTTNIRPTRILRPKVKHTVHIKGPIKPVLNQTGEGRENFPRKAIEDKEIIEKLNQFLLDNKIQYSCLFGVDNNPIKEKDIPYFTQCEPNDGEFPEIISLITEQMVKNYRNHGENCVSLVECAHKVRMVNDSLAFQLSPTNSRYFVYGIFALTNNLEPSLLSINLSTDRARQQRRQQVYYTFMKHLLQANNKQMTELRNENIYKMELRQKHSRRKEAEVVYDYEFSFPKKVFGKVEAEFVAAAEQLKMEFSISFDLLHSYLDRLQLMTKRFMRYELKRQKQVRSYADGIIKKMLTTNNSKQVDQSILSLNKHNQEFVRRVRKFNLRELCLFHFPPHFVGFHVFEHYQNQFCEYLNHLVLNNNGSLLKIFLQNVIDQEIVDRRRVKLSYEDTAHILFTNPRLGKLKTIIEPKVLQELVDVFTLCRSLKIERDTVQRKYIVGSDQRNRKTTVSYLEQKWVCECQYVLKIGIPCLHLMRVLREEKTEKYQCYVSKYYFKNRISFLETLDLG